ncbi:DNA gyrase inhibitor YacG [Siculibacillus lacustris]|uniref:DNA gyrase inhibitor YacG n=1 Tax=Siculibacillus lacustris TaxID=1549641 RepID=A0A4V2KTU9_9HYPH|nr:DNA gyrase inhibitor YacG [Siculibacillus lacustris]TBW38780.1 DNA gyrase inhibitor YacG [Siculibacillus lacustris]
MASATPPPGDAPARPCPICGKPASAAARPFCSPRCRQVDLHHWLTGRYAIPVVESDDDDEA